jgi:hypothetical protein
MNHPHPPARTHRHPGQTLVELLLVLPILLLLLLGLVGVGQVLLVNYTVTQAARVGAHQGALAGGLSPAAADAAANVIAGGVGTDPGRAQIRVTCPRDPCRRYDPVTVAITYADSFWAPLPPLFVDFTVAASATRAAERDSQ